MDRICSPSCMAMGNGHCRVLDMLKRIADSQEKLTEQYKSIIESAWLK